MAKTGSEATTWGRRLARLAWSLLGIVAAVRALCFGVYAALMVPFDSEVHSLEAKMVHLAWRVQHGVQLYPPWQDGPFVANFFGPLYFGLVGLLGRLLGSSLDQLAYVGRGVTLTALALTVAVAAGLAGRRSGRFAGAVAGLLVIGAAPFFGFGVMTRPDVFACLLGLIGFLLATARRRPWMVAGAIVLVLAILAKQTTALYLAGAVLALLVEGRWRPALAIGLGTGLGLVALVGGITLLDEPRFAADLFGERLAPWDLDAYRVLLWRVSVILPELPIGLWIGVGLWGFGPASVRDRRLAVLAVVLGLGCTIAAGKIGSDLNYFLPWAPLAAVAYAEAAVLLVQLRGSRAWLGLLAALLLSPALVLSFLHSEIQAASAIRTMEQYQSPRGQAFHADFRKVLALGRDRSTRILTDSGPLDIQRGEQTQFGDPWLLHLLAETGRVKLDQTVRAIDDEQYDFVITTKPLSDPTYDGYDFGMPMPMVEAARRHYEFERRAASLFIHRRKGNPFEARP